MRTTVPTSVKPATASQLINVARNYYRAHLLDRFTVVSTFYVKDDGCAYVDLEGNHVLRFEIGSDRKVSGVFLNGEVYDVDSAS